MHFVHLFMFFVVLNNNRPLFPWTTLNGQSMQPLRIVFSVKCELNFVSSSSFFVYLFISSSILFIYLFFGSKWSLGWVLSLVKKYLASRVLCNILTDPALVDRRFSGVVCRLFAVVVNYEFLVIAEKNGASVTAAVDMKTPAARKQASRRIVANSGQKPTPLRGEWGHPVPFCGPQVRVLWLSPRVIVTLIAGSCNCPRRYKSR